MNDDDDEPVTEWEPARLIALALTNLAVVHHVVATAEPARLESAQRALVESTALAVEVGRALLAGAFVSEHEGYRIRELAEDLSAEFSLRRRREMAAVKGGEKIALKAALMRHGDHLADCPRRPRPAAGQCTCGWSEIAQEIGAIA